jgi:hypothetical protein
MSVTVVSIEPMQPAETEASASLTAQRDSDLVLAYWRQKTEASSRQDDSPFLDLAVIETAEWRHRFVMTIDEAEDPVLLLWGTGVADLFGIPPGQRTHVPLSRGIPEHYSSVFVQGCAAIRDRQAPIRVEAQVSRDDARQELVRASFVPITVGGARATRLAFGTINRKVV